MKKLVIDNFQSIEHAEVELAPITLFVGRSNSGKSAILRALQSVFEQPSQYNALKRNGASEVKVEVDGDLYQKPGQARIPSQPAPAFFNQFDPPFLLASPSEAKKVFLHSSNKANEILKKMTGDNIYYAKAQAEDERKAAEINKVLAMDGSQIAEANKWYAVLMKLEELIALLPYLQEIEGVEVPERDTVERLEVFKDMAALPEFEVLPRLHPEAFLPEVDEVTVPEMPKPEADFDLIRKVASEFDGVFVPELPEPPEALTIIRELQALEKKDKIICPNCGEEIVEE